MVLRHRALGAAVRIHTVILQQERSDLHNEAKEMVYCTDLQQGTLYQCFYPFAHPTFQLSVLK